MSTKFVLASVGTVQLIDQSTGDLIVTSKTLVDSGINFSVTAEDIRGGMANALISQYFHDSAMELTLTDALFSLEYLALNVGGTIQAGADVLGLESIVVDTANKITVAEIPKPFGTLGTIGWYSLQGEDNWTKITFNPETKTAEVGNLPVGSKICVKYTKTDSSAEMFTVSSSFVPSQCVAILTLPLFKSGTNATQFSNSSKAGEVQVEIPNFILSGSVNLALTSAGATTTALSGRALATYVGGDCESQEGYYAHLKQVTYNKDEFADVKSIVVADSSIDLAIGEKQILEVVAIYGGIKAPKNIENSKLTFVSSATNVAEVSENGEITGLAQGTSVIDVVVSGGSHPDLIAKAVVTVE